jgi:hypothetical protein
MTVELSTIAMSIRSEKVLCSDPLVHQFRRNKCSMALAQWLERSVYQPDELTTVLGDLSLSLDHNRTIRGPGR